MYGLLTVAKQVLIWLVVGKRYFIDAYIRISICDDGKKPAMGVVGNTSHLLKVSRQKEFLD